MVLPTIATLLSQTIGLDPNVVGDSRLARAVDSRRVSCQSPDLSSYWQQIQTSETELEALIELLVVPETWFFRDGKPFDYLKTYATSEWRPLGSSKPLHLLSVPSSTGEEPYSIAIALLEAGLNPKQFVIDAIDISYRSIEKAKRAVYTKNSFRGEAWTDRDRYFQPTKGGYELCQSVRDLVNFQQGNVMTTLAQMQKRYDVIFCRNLLIYLQPDACTQVLGAINQRLNPGGLLFLGASETGKMVDKQYVFVRQPFTFAYRKSNSSPPPTKTLQQISSGATKRLSLQTQPRVGRAKWLPELPPSPPKLEGNSSKSHRSAERSRQSPVLGDTGGKSTKDATSKPSPLADLQTVRQLADAGRLTDAMAQCQMYLNENPTSAAAYLLLGELYQANQQYAKAEQSYQRAIYLEPNSYKVLVHLALLKEHQGDTAGAAIIHQRIHRLPHSLRAEV